MKRLETKEDYDKAVEERDLLKLRKFQPNSPLTEADTKRIDELDELIAQMDRRREHMLLTMDVIRSGFGGMNKEGMIVDRRENLDATPLQANKEFNTPAPKPLTLAKFDFYYSRKEALYNAVETRIYFNNVGVGPMTVNSLLVSYFKDKMYTKAVIAGKPKPDEFDDYVLVGTGEFKDTRMRGKWYEEPKLKQPEQ